MNPSNYHNIHNMNHHHHHAGPLHPANMLNIDTKYNPINNNELDVDNTGYNPHPMHQNNFINTDFLNNYHHAPPNIHHFNNHQYNYTPNYNQIASPSPQSNYLNYNTNYYLENHLINSEHCQTPPNSHQNILPPHNIIPTQTNLLENGNPVLDQSPKTSNSMSPSNMHTMSPNTTSNLHALSPNCNGNSILNGNNLEGHSTDSEDDLEDDDEYGADEGGSDLMIDENSLESNNPDRVIYPWMKKIHVAGVGKLSFPWWYTVLNVLCNYNQIRWIRGGSRIYSTFLNKFSFRQISKSSMFVSPQKETPETSHGFVPSWMFSRRDKSILVSSRLVLIPRTLRESRTYIYIYI